MTDQNFLMYSQNRFANAGMGGGNRLYQNPFEVASSAAHRQFHQMKAEMPSDVIQLFKANQIGFLKAPVKPKCRKLDPLLTMGINIMQMFQIPNLELMQAQRRQTKEQRIQRVALQNKEKNQQRIQKQIKSWNPFQTIQKIDSDPEKTLFVGRLNYQTTQKNLKFCFEKYGIIKNAYVVKDKQGKSRGYGFVQFDSKQDFLNAYKQAVNIKLQGKRLIVDYERGRTTLKWRPRRFDGGLGQSRMSKDQLSQYRTKLKQKRQNVEKNKKKQMERHRSRSRSPYHHRDDRDRKQRSSRQRKNKRDRREKNDRYR